MAFQSAPTKRPPQKAHQLVLTLRPSKYPRYVLGGGRRGKGEGEGRGEEERRVCVL